MKIVCEACGAKYTISDDKVQGKTYKVRCKKCSRVIIVRGDGTATDAPREDEPPPTEAASLSGAAVPAASAADGDGGWHLVVNRQQVGPVSTDDVRGMIERGEIDGGTFGWREGMGEWSRIDGIPELAPLVGGAATTASSTASHDDDEDDAPPAGGDSEATRRTSIDDVFAAHQAKANGAAAAPHDDEEDTRTGEAPHTGDEDDKGGEWYQQAATAAATAPTPAPARDRERVKIQPRPLARPQEPAPSPEIEIKNRPLMRERGDSSLLFKVDNLRALAAPPPSEGFSPPKKPGYADRTQESSGLVDIRHMAAAIMSPSPKSENGSHDHLPPMFSSAVAAPIVMPMAAGTPKWLWPVIAGGVGLVVLMVIVVTVLLVRHPTVSPEQIAAMQKLQQQVQEAQHATAPTLPTAAIATPTAPTTPSAATTPTAAADDGGKRGKAGHGSKHGAAAAPSSTRATTPTAPAPAPAAPSHGSRKKGDDVLDQLLDGAAPSSPKKSSAPARAPVDDNLPEQLSRGDITSAMAQVVPKAQACGRQFHTTGTAMVAMTIQGSGHVGNASVNGALAGTPTAGCIVRAVKSQGFKKFKGSPMSISYPFVLH